MSRDTIVAKGRREQVTLVYPLRLPDEIQADALRLLAASCEVTNLVVTALWRWLDRFATRTHSYAYQQVASMMAPPLDHGRNQWWCEAEQAGRILRAQVERKRQFAVILPLLTQGMILPRTETRRAGKCHKAIKQALADLRAPDSDGGHVVEWQSLIEQACNYYLQNGRFPKRYEDMQAVPVLKAGILPYAVDDGPVAGKAYRLSCDLARKRLLLALRTPDDRGVWMRNWQERIVQIALPELVVERIRAGKMLAPVLREIIEPDGNRYAVLDFVVSVPAKPLAGFEAKPVLGFDWGVRKLITACVIDLDGHQVSRPFFLDTGPFDGRQARLRRQIDRLQAKVERLEKQRDRFPVDDPKRRPSERALPVLRREIDLCWRKYEARNNNLAHLAVNVLLMLATVFDCRLIAGESLKTMKSTGRGKDVRGRWRNWRNNTQIRGVLWRVLRYKCFEAGVHLEWQRPWMTSHVCPRCGRTADTHRSPKHRDTVNDRGAWLWCSNPSCCWNGSRDYAASLNIARLGATFIQYAQKNVRVRHLAVTGSVVQPISYMGMRAALRLLPQAPRGRLIHSGRIYCNGWVLSISLRPSHGFQ